MTEPTPSPARARLLAKIARHRTALVEQERIAEAQRRLDDEFYERLQPAVRSAMDRLDDAKRVRPQLLVAAALGEPASGPDIAEAECLLADAQRKVFEGREARHLVEDAAQRARAAAAIARQDLDAAVAAVIAASPELAALQAEYEATRQHLSAITGALQAAGHAPPLGIMRLDDTAFENAEWSEAIRLLAEDADAPLPAPPALLADTPENLVARPLSAGNGFGE